MANNSLRSKNLPAKIIHDLGNLCFLLFPSFWIVKENQSHLQNWPLALVWNTSLPRVTNLQRLPASTSTAPLVGPPNNPTNFHQNHGAKRMTKTENSTKYKYYQIFSNLHIFAPFFLPIFQMAKLNLVPSSVDKCLQEHYEGQGCFLLEWLLAAQNA